MKRIKGPRLINTSRRKKSTVIHAGEQFDATVKALSDTGKAIVEHPSGMVVFVAGLWLGERATVEITQVKKRHGLARVVDLIEVSRARLAQPQCQYHGFDQHSCGGCPWLFVDYTAQLQAKFDRANAALSRLQSDIQIQPVWPSPEQLGYRLRAQFKTDGHQLGFVSLSENTLVDIDHCPVLNSGCQSLLQELREQLPNPSWKPAKQRRWRTIDVQSGLGSTPGEGSPPHEVPDLISVDQRLPFRQVNQAQNQRILQWLETGLRDLPTSFVVVELFAGSGNLTRVAAQRGFDSIVAAEVVAEAVEHLNILRLPNVRGELVDLYDPSRCEQFWQQHRDAKVVIVDPPREGIKITAPMLGRSMAMEHLFYISCDLATLCRDLADFIAIGFRMIEIQPLDMFPQTPHLEILVHLQRES